MIATIALAAGIVWFSPSALLLLIVCVVPAFLGESHFAFLGYSQAFRQTPVKRQMDYLRYLGVSQSAKELKVFGLNRHLTDRFANLSDQIYVESVSLAKRRFLASSFLTLLATFGYYGGYVYIIYQTLAGRLSVGTLPIPRRSHHRRVRKFAVHILHFL